MTWAFFRTRSVIAWPFVPEIQIWPPNKKKSKKKTPQKTHIQSKKHSLLYPVGNREIVLFAFVHFKQTTLVQFSHSVVSDSLWPCEPQHVRPPCPSPNPGVHPNPCPLSQWCHWTISSSVIPFSCCPQSFPASGSFPVSQLFTSGGQSIGVSASASVLPMNTQDWSPLGWTDWISLQSKGLSSLC